MGSLKDKLKDKLTKKEISLLVKGFDIIGDIAVIEIPEELKKKQKVIAQAILEQHKNVKVVAKKASKVEGVERIRKVRVIAGEKRTETLHKENGISLVFDINKVYYSPRLSSERLRVMEMTRSKEHIIDMFAGVGPFAILIARNKEVKIDAIDINKEAYKYLNKSIKENKLRGEITTHKGDAGEIIKKLEKADRIIMNLPESSMDFLDGAVSRIKKGGVIHLYAFEKNGDITRKLRRKKYKIENKMKCGAFSPEIQRVCFDLKF